MDIEGDQIQIKILKQLVLPMLKGKQTKKSLH